MHAQRFLRLLITRAIGLWGLGPFEIYRDARLMASQARSVVCVVAYRHDCSSRDVRTAFGWSRMLADYYQGAACSRHERWLADETYRSRIEELARYAEEIRERQAA